MEVYQTTKLLLFLVLSLTGVQGNLTVFLAFIHIACSGQKWSPSDTITVNLSFTNLLLVTCRGVPQTLTAFGLKNLFNTPGCKFILFCFRTMRAASISLTFLLSISQSIIIAPASSRLAVLKKSLPRNLLCSLIWFWLLSGFTSIASILYTKAAEINATLSSFTLNLEYCFTVFPGKTVYEGTNIMVLVRDTTMIALMASASWYIVYILFKHRKQVKNICSSGHHRGVSAETRAAKAVITLVILYVIFFGIDNMIWIYTFSVPKVSTQITDTRVFFSLLYATIFPLVIILSNKKVSNSINYVMVLIKYKEAATAIVKDNKAHVSK
ncbi:olfactory receptor class A-like protein 1 [Protopterus annectens]|uniref:olfactory receptor class A-like protein 1 n=1 Tax=Protopterus annectens TaxID=7888 RepID=UPI001CFA8360|nr:olfactory receptor class A-like protein 1 [Protopterus annectens]